MDYDLQSDEKFQQMAMSALNDLGLLDDEAERELEDFLEALDRLAE